MKGVLLRTVSTRFFNFNAALLIRQFDFRGEHQLRDLKDEELERRMQEIREEKTRLTEAFVSGRIPQDIYRKTVIRLEKAISEISSEIGRRATKKK